MAAKKTGRPTLEPAQAEHVRAALRELRDSRFGGNQAKLAEAIGIKPPSLFAIMEGHNAPSYPTCLAIAKLMGVHIELLLGGERAAPLRFVEEEDRYPNRAKAVVAARALGLSEEAIARVRSSSMSRPDDPTPREWLRKIESADDDVRHEQHALPADVERAEKTRAANAARAAEMEEVTRPKLPKRRVAK